eukprot:CAMPEP_0181095664 /NCGR_PEP_ID=MMETSP1071-20121207/10631_1 /TAXON_ID=35127 /ORGANISM="Thalassiosira sp., Strain NH16" /LENGTH=312 /DNA_ID=CAMNT_0023178043 /DNA_START=1 /DNA_END=939 /DNA_ORIENTATION=-
MLTLMLSCYCFNIALALSVHPRSNSNVGLPNHSEVSRRDAMTHLSRSSSAADTTPPADAAASAGLANKLSKRDPAQLKNSVFNIPPGAQVYPEFLRGSWDVTMKYRGFLFPSTTIAKDKIVADVGIPGFQKLSIAQVGDVGREVTTYQMSVDPATGLEDRKVSLASSINSHLGYDAVREVLYDARENANRLSVDFVPQRTRNANRIELFCNARESELVPAESSASGRTVFVCSEYVRQVTFGLSQEFGVARQAVGNYAHFWTWRADEGGDKSTVTGNLLTAAYLDAQDPMFFDEPSKPVVVYSHDLVAKKRS